MPKFLYNLYMNSNIASIAPVYNRCVRFTLADGTVIDVKVMGEKADAAVAAKRLIAVLNASK